MDPLSNMAIFSGSSNPKLAIEICNFLGIRLYDCLLKKFNNGETRVEIGSNENVRGKKCYIIQTCVDPVNDHLMEMLILADALKRASAAEITAVTPSSFYVRQDRKIISGVPITAKLVINLMRAAGIARLITMDLHAAQIQGFSDDPFDNLYASPLLLQYIQESLSPDQLVFVAPDENAVKRARAFAMHFGARLGMTYKFRDNSRPGEIDENDGTTRLVMLIGEDVEEMDVIILDDMIDTGGTMAKSAKVLLSNLNRARSVHAMATHAIFSCNALSKLQEAGVKSVVVTDTMPLDSLPEFVICLKTAPLLGEAIKRVHLDDKLSSLFTVAL